MGFTIKNGVLKKYTEEPGISEVIIPEGVSSIGRCAFMECENLTSITISEGVSSIGRCAFMECENLTSISLPESLTSIGHGAFAYCESLTSIIIPDSVVKIGTFIFEGCSSLTKIVAPDRLTSVTIRKGVTDIDERMFKGNDILTNITIPEGVMSIGEEAFAECESLTSITLPEGLTSIGDKAFQDCRSLTSITIPEGVTSIGYKAFAECESLTSITIPKGVTSIGEYAFYGCKSLTSITLPESLTSIGDKAFGRCESLTSITIPEGVTSIGDKAFAECESLTSITIPEGLTSIEGGAFLGCESLTSITIPEGVTSIGDEAFEDCRSLTSITLPESLTSIEGGAFVRCKSLTSITIPEGVTSIGKEAFWYCESLTSISLPESLTSIEYGAFAGCKSLTSITLPESLTSIGDKAFGRCESLTSITLPESLTSIGDEAFEDCRSLTSITIPEGVTRIGKYAFRNCIKLTSISLPESLTNIDRDAFRGCSALTEIFNLLPLLWNGCEVENTTLVWLLENPLSSPEYLKETAFVYLAKSSKTVNKICEDRLVSGCARSADLLLELIEPFSNNTLALKKLANFVLFCGPHFPREKLPAIHEQLIKVGAKSAVKVLEKAVLSEESIKMEGATGHPIEAVCLERFKEVFIDRDLESYGIPPKLFTGVHYQGTETKAPEFVVKCAIHPYMYKLRELPRAISGYRTDFVEVDPDPQIDEIAASLNQEELQELLQTLINQFEPFKWRLLFPYCRYGSGKQMSAIAAMIKKWQVWRDYRETGRRFIIVLHGAMMLNESREALLLIEKWGLLEDYARRMKTTADVLRDTVLTEFNLNEDGNKRYDLGNAVIAASLASDLSVSLLNETAGKEVKSLPKKGADPEKYEAASKDFADLKKNIKNAVNSKVKKLRTDFASGFETKTSEWKASYIQNFVLKRIASLLVWQWQHNKTTRRFMLTMDSTFIDCDGKPIEIGDGGTICLAHPVEIPPEELECWKELLTQKQISQPFVQMFEPVYDIEPAQAAKRYTGIELPMFLLRRLAKDGIEVDDYFEGEIWFYGLATRIYGTVYDTNAFTAMSIAFNDIVTLKDVTIEGTPRAVNHEIFAMDKALIENRVRNGDIAAIQAFANGITAKTIQHLIDVSIEMEQMECTAWLMSYKNEHFPYALADLEL